uniref:Uncharacterized protein LOC110214532 n=1 Tax=Phascolarctos cinereus TaxID=38626 RepID=A0A6P5KYZ7_PHACI|nr:uncharacterized protein LOC110214532 [Phascolarctos cinereus]
MYSGISGHRAPDARLPYQAQGPFRSHPRPRSPGLPRQVLLPLRGMLLHPSPDVCPQGGRSGTALAPATAASPPAPSFASPASPTEDAAPGVSRAFPRPPRPEALPPPGVQASATILRGRGQARFTTTAALGGSSGRWHGECVTGRAQSRPDPSSCTLPGHSPRQSAFPLRACRD